MKKDKLPDRLPADLRVYKGEILAGWEDMMIDEDTAAGWFRTIKRKLTRLGIKIEPSAKFLEIGSGNGVLLGYLKKQKLDIVGVDARPRHKGELPVAAARIERLPFKNDSFDFVLASAVFDPDVYRQYPEAMTAEINRVLKKDGTYVALSDHSAKPVKNMRLISEPTDAGVAVYGKLIEKPNP